MYVYMYVILNMIYMFIHIIYIYLNRWRNLVPARDEVPFAVGGAPAAGGGGGGLEDASSRWLTDDVSRARGTDCEKFFF
jgi:hypothetical protein